MLLLALPARAQLQVGRKHQHEPERKYLVRVQRRLLELSRSDHGITPSGNADLSGFYYSPAFLSFDVQPFYDESRNNSTYQSVFQSSGLNGNVSLFSGSHFPGTVSYSKIYNSEGGFAVPGAGNFTTRGNSRQSCLGWGIRVPDFRISRSNSRTATTTVRCSGPMLTASFHARMFGVVASDKWAGFTLNGGYHYNTVHSLTPEFLVGEAAQTTDTSSNTFDFNVGHKLPFRGAFSASASKSDVNTQSETDKFNGSIDSVNSGVTFEPVRNLNLGVTAQYTNNLEGTLYQSAITTGEVLPTGLLNYSTHSVDINSQANYTLPTLHLNFVANADHREQSLMGTSLTANTLDEMGTYGNELLGRVSQCHRGRDADAGQRRQCFKLSGFLRQPVVHAKVWKLVLHRSRQLLA